MNNPDAFPPRKAPDLCMDLVGLTLRNPVMVASGTFGYGPEYSELLAFDRLGAVVVKGISMQPAEGNRPPRTIETPSGLLNAIGLQNPGFAGFVRDYLPFLRKVDVPLVVNIWGRGLEEYTEVAAAFDSVDGIAALELNVSCPNIKEGGHVFGTDLGLLEKVTSAVRRCTRLPLIVKLSPNVPVIADYARAAAAAGADALSLINSLPGMAIDIETRRPVLANISGGLTGPAIHPVALKLVWEAARAVRLPVIGMGGITSAREALAFLIAGATAVAVGTATFSDPGTALRVVQGISDYLAEKNIPRVADLVGTLELP